MKTLYTIYNNFAKRNLSSLRFLLVMLLTLTVSANAWGEALTGNYTKITDISNLSDGDRVVLYADYISKGVTGWNGNKDATVSESGWVEYLVESVSSGVYLKDENADDYIASPGSSNQFKYGTKAVCTVNDNGVLKCNNRFLAQNGTNYRMYSSIGSYNPFYVYKVSTAAPSYDITVKSNNDTYGSVSISGKTITATPKDGYRVKSGDAGYTVTSGTADVTNNGNNTFTVTPESECTVQINFESKGCIDKGASSITSGTFIGDDYGPLHAYYGYSTSQILYTKSDLDLATGKKGSIKSIYFEYAGSSEMDARTINIYMANTTLSSLSTSSYVPYSSFSLVYEGSFSCSSAGWYEITLDTPFEYSGTGNLAVMVDDNTNSYQDSKNFKYHSANGAQIYKRQDNTDIDPENWTPASEINYRPNTKFCIQEVDMTPVTVTLMDNGATITEDLAGAGVTLPPRDGCEGYTFAGWTKSWTEEQDEWTTTAPTIISAGSYTPTANESLYPVYTKSVEDDVEGTPEDINISPSSFSADPLGSGNYASGKEYTATIDDITFGGHYIAYNVANTPSGASAKAYIQMQKNNGNLYNITAFPGPITKIAISQNSAATANLSLYVGTEQLFASNNTQSGQTPGGELVETKTGNSITWEITEQKYTHFCLKKGNEGTCYISSISITYLSGGGSTTYYISVPDCDPCNALQAPNVTAKNITTNSFTLSWDPVAGATSYNVCNITTDETAEITDLTYTFSGLTPNTAYEWKVEAVSATCNGKGKTGTTTTLQAYTITWKNADGTVLETDENVPHGTTPTYNGATPTKTATAQYTYTFSDWSPTIYAADKDQVYTAQFSETLRQYTVTFNANGHGTAPDAQIVDYNKKATEPSAPTATGYTFGGWYKESGCTNSWNFATDVVTGNVTLYAKWTEKPLTRYRTDCDACIPLDGYAEINGTYHFFPSETITLTVTPPADAVPYTYQWQKFVVDKWEDIDGETTTTYTKAEAKIEDVGHYRCVVSAEGYCDAIAEYNVKCLQLNVYYDDHTLAFTTPLEKVDATTAIKSVNLENANYKYYFEITDGCENFYGFNGDIHSGWYENVELNAMNSSTHCGLQTTKFGTYIFTVDHSYLTDDSKFYPVVTVTYPASLQEADKVIYLDNHVLDWTNSDNAEGKNKIYYRIGREDYNSKTAMTLVPGTANLYKVTTSEYNNFEVWHIANNGCWSENHPIYKTKTDDDWAATQATAFETLPVTLESVTVTPTTSIGNGGEDRNSNCEFFNYDITEGMKTWNAEVIEPTNGTITVSYTHHDGTVVNNFTSGNRDLAHTCLLTITATPDAGYSLASLTVNDVPFTSGKIHTLTEDAVIKAEFTINTHTVTWKPAGGNWDGDANDIVQEYKYGTPIEAPDKPVRIGYEFVEWKPTYTAGMTMPDEDLEFTAQWQINQYTVTLNPNYPASKTGTFIDKEGNPVNSNLVLTYNYNTASMLLTDLYQSIELEGYRFDGWYNAKGSTAGDVSGSKCTVTNTIERDLTFYAKWTEVDCRWIETDIANITSEDEVVVVITTKDGNTWALPHSGGTKTQPTVIPVTVNGNSLSGKIDNAIKWNIANDEGNLTFYPNGTMETWLYCNNDNNGVRVGTNGDKIYTIDASNGYLKHTATNRYVGVYSNQDWRCYTSINNSNIPGQTLKFYKRVCVDASNPWYTVTFNAGSGSCDTVSLTGTKEDGIILPTATPSGACATDGWVFAGWWTNEVGETTTSPGELLTAGSNYKPKGNITLHAVYSKTGEGGGGDAKEGTISFASTAQRVSQDADQQVWANEGITLTNTKGTGDGDASVGNYYNPARFYAGSKIIISAPENITKIVFDCNSGSYATAMKNSIGGEASVSGDKVTLELDGTSNTYTISSISAQVRIDALTVTYSAESGPTNTTTYNSNPDCATYTLIFNDRGVETSDEYSAGYQVPQPADPTDVCTEPIEYVFDGWATAEITAENVTSYEKVTFPFTMPAESTTLYAVYRYVEEGSGDSGDYVKVTDDLDDYSGDYLFVYEAGNVAFDGGLDELDETENTIAVTISNNTIESNATTDVAKFTIAKVDGGYSIQSASGYFIGWSSADKNGLNANSKYSANYYLNTIANSIIRGVKGTLKFNKTSGQERFRYYQSGQETIALYRKAASYLYTTSPVCGPHLAITEGKNIYVTGGNAGGTRDLVIAQQKVSYKATRLNVGPTSQVPDVKVATNGITVGGVVTSDVKVTIDQTKEQQADGTYTITGTITVQYQPSANNKQEDIQVQLAVDYNAEARDNFTVHARSLPAEFVIVAKSGDKWYALNGDMNTNAANPANGQVTLDNDDNPTKATYAPCNAIYTFDGLPNTGDRTYVRFQGTDGAWLWASSGTNVGIQNNVLKTTPEGNNNAYNWKLYTQDNITYRFGNANSNRQLTLNGEKFGMYASGVQDIRILPYVEKCLYNYAPTNLKVSVLKGSYVTLTWDAVAGATKYQYSTDATNWTDCGTEPTATINGLTGDTEYTYYIRAYHEDAGVSQECIDYAEITFTTADCDDVPTNITYTADLNSITVSWTAAAPTATITYNTKEDGTGGGGIINNATSPYKISGGLDKNTTYYIQILSDGTCASPIIPVKTEDVELDIVEWKTDSIVVDINTNETVGVTLENEVSYGTGLGSLAEDLFFSKYFEGSGSLKMIAIYNGTGKDVDLTDYFIYKGHNGSANFDEDDQDKISYPLSELGVIKQGQEIVLYSWPLNTDAEASVYSCSQTFLHSIANESGQDANPRWILCGKAPTNSITPIYSDAMNFNGDDPLLLYKDGEIIDVFGATDGESPENNVICDGYNENGNYKTRSDESWVANDVSNMDYGKTAEDFPNGEIPDDVNVDDPTITAYTARVIMFRKNSVTSGANAVTKNTNDFHTFAEEWEVRQVCRISGDGDLTCAAYQELGTFDYSDYYTKYVPMDGGTSTFDENDRNSDGTVTISIPELYKRACSNIRVKLTNSDGEVLTDREYKVPIMITTTQGTDGQAFLDLQQNLATVEVDGEDNVIKTYPLSLDEVREICKTCDVVIRDNATLTKVTDGTTNDHPQVRDVMIYEGASLEVDGANHNYTINSLSLRRKGDIVASAKVEEGGKLHLPASATAPIYLDMRVDANNWHWFTLPYNCNIADVTWVDGTPAQYNKDWFIMYYDGNSRANEQSIYENHWKVYNGTTIEAGKGYIVGIQGDITHPNHTFELRFPMATEVLTNEHVNKTVAVNAWGVNMDITPNKKGWNLVGNPYLDYYKTSENISFTGLSLIEYLGIDPVTGERLYKKGGTVPFLVTPVDGGWYEYQQELASDVEMMPFTAYFVQVGDPKNPDHTDGMELHAEFVSDHRGRMSLIRRAPQEVDGEQEPVIVRVEVANAKGESDKTTLIIDDRFTNEYEMNADFFKWFGDYYRRYTKPVLYSMGADAGKRAFNALSEQLAAQPVALGMFAAQAGDYTFSLTRKRCDLSRVEEVWLYDATTATYTNLMQQDYTFTTAKTEGEGRFYLSVKMKQKTPTAVENVNGNLSLVAHQQTLVLSGLPAEAQVWVYDATGKLLHSEHTTAYQRIYPVQQAGVYFVSVKGQGDAQTLSTIVK